MTHEIDDKRRDDRSPAHPVSGVTRRVAMLSISAATIASPSIAQGAPQEGFQSDREIIRLAAEFFELKPRHAAACVAAQDAYDIYGERRPSEPDALLWRMGDPVSHSYDVERDGKLYLVCKLSQIKRRKIKPRVIWEFVGTDEEFETMTGSDSFDDLGDPVPHRAHLWQSSGPDKRAAERMTELAAALESYESDCEAIRDELGLEEHDANTLRLEIELDGLIQRLIGLRAYSIEALRAKAAVVAQVPIDMNSEIGRPGYNLVRSIVRDLGGEYPFAGAPLPEVAL